MSEGQRTGISWPSLHCSVSPAFSLGWNWHLLLAEHHRCITELPETRKGIKTWEIEAKLLPVLSRLFIYLFLLDNLTGPGTSSLKKTLPQSVLSAKIQALHANSEWRSVLGSPSSPICLGSRWVCKGWMCWTKAGVWVIVQTVQLAWSQQENSSSYFRSM